MVSHLRKNWAGNVRFSFAEHHSPDSVDELIDVVRVAGKVKAVGSRHSFSGVADTEGVQVDLQHFRNLQIDSGSATIGAGLTYADCVDPINQSGFALHNLGSLPHIRVVGAVSTGTHGSGVQQPNLSSAVKALTLVTASGEVAELAGGDAQQLSVSLGLLGVITQVTLGLKPAFEVKQLVYDSLPEAIVWDSFNEIISSARSVSLFTTWTTGSFDQLWRKIALEDADFDHPLPEFYGAVASKIPVHPIRGVDPMSCTEQLGFPGPWHRRLPHFRAEFTPSHGDEIQSEYFVPIASAVEALQAIKRVAADFGDDWHQALYISEVRTVKGDTNLLSPCFERDSLAIHFTWKNLLELDGNPDRLNLLLDKIEAALAPFGARPHWGKVHRFSPMQMKDLHPGIARFMKLRRTWDPNGKFLNASTAFLE